MQMRKPAQVNIQTILQGSSPPVWQCHLVRRCFLGGALPLMPIVLIMGVPGFGVSSPLSCVSVSLYDMMDVYKIYGGDHFIIYISQIIMLCAFNLHSACMLSYFSRVQFCATPWTVAHQAPLSMGFSRQEHCGGSPCPPPEGLSNPGMEPTSLMSPAIVDRFFATSAT